MKGSGVRVPSSALWRRARSRGAQPYLRYETGTDAAADAAGSVGVFWPEGEDPPSRDEIERRRAAASRAFAAEMIETPDAEPLELPNRRYYVWAGPLRSALAFRHEWQPPPSLVWPEDPSWFVGVPIYTFEIAVAGSTAAIDAVTADQRLGARRATRTMFSKATTDGAISGSAAGALM
jgi:hypothetical protein